MILDCYHKKQIHSHVSGITLVYVYRHFSGTNSSLANDYPNSNFHWDETRLHQRGLQRPTRHQCRTYTTWLGGPWHPLQ